MARPGVTFQEVAAAAHQLMGQGKNPTIEQIRLALGTGSSTTIANHLRQWKEQQTGANATVAKDHIPTELISMVKGLWERVIDHSELKVMGIETDYQQELADLAQELLKYKHNNKRWQQLFNKWMKEKDRIASDMEILRQEAEALRKENAALFIMQKSYEQQLDDKQARIDELHHLHREIKETFAIERKHLQDHQLSEKQQFETTMEHLTDEKRLMQETLTQSQQDCHLLQKKLAESSHAYDTLENDFAKLVSKFEMQQCRLDESEQSKKEYLKMNQYLQSQHQLMEKKLEQYAKKTKKPTHART